MPGKISIIVPVYNEEEFIKENYMALKNSEYENIEIIYIDDGSTDNTYDVLSNISIEDKRVKLFKKANGGPASARNDGIKLATGEYIFFCDADDILDRSALAKMIKMADRYDTDLVIGDIIRVDNNGVEHRKAWKDESKLFDGRKEILHLLEMYLYNERQHRILCSVWGKLYRTKIIRNNNICFSEELRVHEDELFLFNYIMHVKSIYYLNEFIYVYYRNRNNCGSSAVFLSPLGYEQHLKIILDYLLKYVKDCRRWHIYELYGNAYCDYAISACYNLIRLSNDYLSLYQSISTIITRKGFRENKKYYSFRNKDNYPLAVWALFNGYIILAILIFKIQIYNQNKCKRGI